MSSLLFENTENDVFKLPEVDAVVSINIWTFPTVSMNAGEKGYRYMGISVCSLCIEIVCVCVCVCVCVHVSMRAAYACWSFAPASIIIAKTIELLPTSTPSRASPAASSIASKMPLPENWTT